MAFLVEVHDVHAGDMDSAPLEDVDLHCGVGEVLLFLGGRRLHLGEVKTAILWGEDVDRDECVVGEEAGFENRRGAVVDQLARKPDALVDGVVWKIDEDAAGEPVSCQRAETPRTPAPRPGSRPPLRCAGRSACRADRRNSRRTADRWSSTASPAVA